MRAIWVAAVAALSACSQGGGSGFGNFAAQGGAGLQIVSPSESGVSHETQPLIRWTAVAGVQRYEVSAFGDPNRAAVLEHHRVGRDATEVRLVRALADGQQVYVEVKAIGPTGLVVEQSSLSRFRVLLLPDFLVPMQLRESDAQLQQGGYKLFNLIDARTPAGEDPVPILVLVNAAGEIVWFHAHPASGVIGDARVLPNGNLMFQLREMDAARTLIATTAVEMTWHGDVVWQSRPGALVHHEAGLGPGGGYLYLTWIHEEVDGFLYEGDGIELVDPATNEVVWEWSIFDHLRPEEHPVPEQDNPGRSGMGGDWSHANAAVWDPGRSLIWVSFRHLERIIGIDYPSGEIRITLGQDGLGGDGLMSHQHAPEVQPDGSILFYDNGNRHDPRVTRAKLIAFDEIAGTVDELFVWEDTPPFFDFAVGDADRQPNGNFLVTAGISGRVIEVNVFGEIVWEVAFDTTRHWTYRAEQVPEELIAPGILPFR